MHNLKPGDRCRLTTVPDRRFEFLGSYVSNAESDWAEEWARVRNLKTGKTEIWKLIQLTPCNIPT